MKTSPISTHSIVTDPNIQFLSLSCSTDTDYLKSVFPDCLKKIVYKICYRKCGLKVSICDYWNGENEDRYLQYLKSRKPAYVIHSINMQAVQQLWIYVSSADPHHRSLYLQRNNFLPILNGEIPHNHMKGNTVTMLWSFCECKVKTVL